MKKRSLLAPEVLQISSMDCGVAALTSFLAGFGIDASYDRLHRACQTGVDGTSIDALEDIARELGLDVCQHLAPPDLCADALEGRYPAVAVARQPGGPPHFVTLWRRLGPRLHLMDPGKGRGWASPRAFEADLYTIRFVLPADVWRDWYAASALRDALTARAKGLLSAARAREVCARLASPDTAAELGALDAALRLV
ncbi:MAG TPA: cysteine peptidase family C39 domain-containing protein, partial [Polyangiaceae bacterium]|nr:cysteine peptidase family C39 domain-containing protein [Polyangiaceae bacterium]